MEGLETTYYMVVLVMIKYSGGEGDDIISGGDLAMII